MVQVSYPGVYIQEVSSGVKTITGVATSITAFFGRAVKGPLNSPVHCLSLADFLRNFGDPHPSSDLAASVKQFYDNGGTDCYVVRLAKNAVAAQLTLQNYANVNVLTVTAKAQGSWANTVRLEVDYGTTNADDTFNLTVIQEQGGQVVQSESFTGLSMNPTSARFAPVFVTASSQLVNVTLDPLWGDPKNSASDYNKIAKSFAGYSNSRRPLGTTAAAVQTTLSALIGASPAKAKFDISVNDSPYVTVDLSTLTIPATIPAMKAQLLDAINNHALNTLSPVETVDCDFENVTGVGFFIVLTATSGALSSVRVRRSSSNDLAAALMLGVDQGGIEATRWSNLRPAVTGTLINFGALTTGIDKIAALLQNDFTKITIDGVDVAINAAPYDVETTAAADAWTKDNAGSSSPSGNSDGVREKLRIIANAISNNPNVPYTAEVEGYHLAIFAKNGTINKTPILATDETVPKDFLNSFVANVRQYTLGTGGTSAFSAGGVAGADGSAPGFAEYVGDPINKTGFHSLDTVDLFNLMVLPTDYDLDEPTRNSLWGPASIYCQSRRAFLIIDAPESWTSGTLPAVVNDPSKINDLRATVIKDYSAVFYPRLKYTDESGTVRLIGPGGAVAGLMARIDASRGVWKAPAGTEADLRGLAGLELKLTDLENGVLNKLGVNCQRIFPTGFVSWGARTMEGFDDNADTDWKYIPIRRLALMIEESLYRGTQWAVFEPNDEPLWARLRLNLGVFMMGLFRQGAFQGATPDQAFYVKCDSETTTQADRNLGRVNIQVGFAPLKPAEFVVITIQQIAGNLS